MIIAARSAGSELFGIRFEVSRHDGSRARASASGWVLSAGVMAAVLFVPAVPVAWALTGFRLASSGQQSLSTLVMTLPAGIFPSGAVGPVAGLVGFGGAIGGR